MKWFIQTALCFAVLISTGEGLAAPELVVETRLPEQVTIGSELEVTFTVTHDADTVVHFPNPVSLNQSFQRLGQKSEVIRETPDTKVERFTLTFTPLRVGKKKLKAFDVPYVDGENAASLTTEPIDIVVVSLLANTVDARFREPPKPKSIYRKNMLLLGIMGAIACILVAILGTLLAIRIFGLGQGKLRPILPHDRHTK